MGRIWRVCAGVGAALLIAACTSSSKPATATVSSSSSCTTAPSSSASSSSPRVFTSARYPYSITLPSGWDGRPAEQTWDGTGAPTVNDAAVDGFGPVGKGAAALAAAAPTTCTLDEWVADSIKANYKFHSDTCPSTPDSVTPVTIGGQPGMLESLNCGILINAAFTVVNGDGYRFGFKDDAVHAATDPTDLAEFTAMLGSVVFR